eukprot:3102472-Rhodomonas_salina.1
MCGQEVIYLRNLLRDLGHSKGDCPTTIYEDNASCIVMSENPVNAERSRHIDTLMWFLHDMACDKLLHLRKCAGTQNVADALTKSLQVLFEAFYVSIGELSASTAGRAWTALQCSSVAAAARIGGSVVSGELGALCASPPLALFLSSGHLFPQCWWWPTARGRFGHMT